MVPSVRRVRNLETKAKEFAPGLVLVAIVATLALLAARALGPLSPLLCAIGLGVAAAPLARAIPATMAGTGFASLQLLRIGVALLGLSVSPNLVGSIGLSGVLIVCVTTGVTLFLTVWIARRMGVAGELGLLIAVGTAICGASAIAAASAAVNARGAAVSYAIGVVTAYGILTMVALPILGDHVIALSPTATGVWAGASIHEVAQVTAAAGAVSAGALKIATVIKLLRVALLAPVIVIARRLGSTPHTRSPGSPIPGFVLAFLACALARALLPIPGGVLSLGEAGSTLLLTLALAALGLEMRIGELRARGIRPLALGMLATLVAASIGLVLVILLHA